MIKLQVIGNLGKDAITNTVNGKNVMNFTVAHTEKFRDNQGNNQERTTWVDCAYWSDKTAVAQYLTKGKQVYVEGTPEVRTFTRNDGTAGASLALRVFNVQLLGGGGQAQQSSNGASASKPAASNASQTSQPAASDIEDPIDDLPF